MESYIVRVYRRDEEDFKKLVGLVEIVGLEETKAFKSFEELWEILASLKKTKSKIRRPGDKEEGI